MKFTRLRCGLWLMLLAAALSGCGLSDTQTPQIYTVTYLDVFDTVTTVRGRSENEAAFQKMADTLHGELLRYHRLFDIYNDYDGIANLKTVNDQAGIAPVAVDDAIIELLLDCRRDYELTGGKVNAAMGSVLRLWHEARTAAAEGCAVLPGEDALREAAAHTDFNDVLIDEEAGTVFLSDPELRLDVGAVAKGWAAERAAQQLPEGTLLSLGGNVRAVGAKDALGTPWVVAVQNPDLAAEGYLATAELTDGSLVTSGDYQRYFTVDGKIYHHIIDPETLFPAAYWSSVTVRCQDSGLADALSTALFVTDREQGQVLLDKTEAEAMWVSPDGAVFASPGFNFREKLGEK